MPTGITSLRYRFDSPDEYDNPAPVVAETPVARFRLASDVLAATLTAPTPTIGTARKLVEPFLRAWEFESELRQGFAQFRFAFEGGQPSGAASDAQLNPPDRLVFQKREQHGIVIMLRSYLEAPSIALLPEMEAVWARYKLARIDIREPLASCAYFALTVLEHAAGGRKAASEKFAIDLSVLRKLGELTTVRGDALTARKASARDAKPLSHNEKKWIDIVVRSALLHMGVAAAGLRPATLKMTDLPVV